MSKFAHRKEIWIIMYNSGMSFRAIAKEEGTTKGTVQRLIENDVTIRPKKPSEQYADEWHRLYLQGWTVIEIANKSDCSTGVVYQRLKEKGVVFESISSPEKQFEHYLHEWVDLYDYGWSLRNIGNEYGVSVQTVSNYISDEISLRNYSDSARIYPVNVHYFDSINSPVKAYWLGYLFANGCIVKQLNSNGFQISGTDEHVNQIETFMKEIGTDRPILKHKNENVYSVRIQNEHLYQNLKKKGLTINKSLQSVFPFLPNGNELIPPFILGYYDGRSYLSIEKTSLYFSGSPKFLHALNDYLYHFLRLRLSLKEVSPNFWQLVSYQKETIYQILDWLYQSDVPFFKPKHEGFLSFKHRMESYSHS